MLAGEQIKKITQKQVAWRTVSTQVTDTHVAKRKGCSNLNYYNHNTCKQVNDQKRNVYINIHSELQ